VVHPLRTQHPWHHSVDAKHAFLHVKFETRFVIFFMRKFLSNKNRRGMVHPFFEMRDLKNWLRFALTLDFKPRFGYKNFFRARTLFCSFFPSSLLFYLPLSFSLLHDDKRTSERKNERTNERTVTLPFSRHVHLLLTITNFLPFASLLFLLTLDRLQRWRRQWRRRRC
jgi:hypothetical protein